MNDLFRLLNVLSAPWSQALLRASVAGGMVLLLAGVLSLTWSKMPANGRSWLWRLAFCKLLLALFCGAALRLPLLPAPPSAQPNPITTSQNAHKERFSLKTGILPNEPLEVAPDEASEANAGFMASLDGVKDTKSQAIGRKPLAGVALQTQSTSRPESVADTLPTPRPLLPTVATGLMMLWLCGVMVGLIRTLLAWRFVRQIRAQCNSVEQGVLTELLADLGQRLKVFRVPQILVGAQIHAPALTGVARPAILLPNGLIGDVTLNETRMILAHELAHQKRHDLAWNWLLCASQILFFFHPAVWWATREWQRANEMACDNMALRVTGVPTADYGKMLVRVALNTRQGTGLFAVGVNERYASLKQRLNALQHITNPERRWIAAIPLVIAAIALVPWGLRARARGEKAANTLGQLPTTSGTEPTPFTPNTTLQAHIVDASGLPVAGATIYAMPFRRNGTEPLAQVKTDQRGRFQLREAQFHEAQARIAQGGEKPFGAQIIVDGGTRGFATYNWFYTPNYFHDSRLYPPTIKLAPLATLQTTLVSNRQPVPNVGIGVLTLNKEQEGEVSIPRAVLNRFRNRTDQKGRVTLRFLPRGFLVRLALDDERSVSADGNRSPQLGGRFAPLGWEDAVELTASLNQSTVLLLPPTTLKGNVTVGDGRETATGTIIELRHLWLKVSKQQERNLSVFNYTLSDYISTVADAHGNYTFTRLRPGTYGIEASPRQDLELTWARTRLRVWLAAHRANHQNATLIKGAIIRGHVVSAQTGKPVAGQKVWLTNEGDSATSDEKGDFRFCATGGKQNLELARDSIYRDGEMREISPPPGFKLPTQRKFALAVPSGATQTVTFKLPAIPTVSPLSGRVVDENNQPVAGAQVSVERLDAEGGGKALLAQVTTDTDGHFSAKVDPTHRTVQVWASTQDKAMPSSVLAVSGDDVTLHLRKNATVTFTGRIVDGNGKPLSGINLSLERFYGNSMSDAARVQTASDGKYLITQQRAGARYTLLLKRTGTWPGLTPVPQPGQTLITNFKIVHPEQFFADEGEDDKSYLWRRGITDPHWAVVSDSSIAVRGNKSGKGKSGVYTLTLYPPSQPDRTVERFQRAQQAMLKSPKYQRAATYYQVRRERIRGLVGTQAAPLTLSAWVNSPPFTMQSLRGKVVLLSFFAGTTQDRTYVHAELTDVAKQFAARGLQVIGVHQASYSAAFGAPQLRALVQDLGITYPVTLDSFTNTPALNEPQGGSATARAYANATLVVVDQTGRVVYAGDSLANALHCVGGLLSPEK